MLETVTRAASKEVAMVGSLSVFKLYVLEGRL